MTASRIFRAGLLAGLAVAAAAGTAHATPLFAAHRAVYEVTLDKAEDRTGISDMNGRLVFEFDGSKCDGYTMSMRFVLRMQLPEDTRITDQQTTTYESGDGNEFRFVTKTFTDQKLDQEIRGSAEREPDAVVVTLQKPDPLDVSLKSSQFPTMHLAEMIEKAKAGVHFYETTLFDGSDEADRLMLTSVVIGDRTEPQKGDDETSHAGAMKDKAYWPVSIAYFDPLKETGGEALPQYRINFKLYENGITRGLVMDYGDFILKGELSDLTLLPVDASCPAQ